MKKNDLSYYSAEEQSLIERILNNPFEMNEFSIFFYELNVIYKEEDILSMACSQLKIEKTKLMAYVILNFWHYSPIHRKHVDYESKRAAAMELAGISTNQYNQLFEDSKFKFIGMYEIIAAFNKAMNPMRFRQIMSNLRLIWELEQNYNETNVRGEDLDKTAKIVEGKKKLDELMQSTEAQISVFFYDDSKVKAQRYELAINRLDRNTLPEMFLIQLKEIYGAKKTVDLSEKRPTKHKIKNEK